MNASDWTPQKENAFREYLIVMATIVRAIEIKHGWDWFYFDMTSGPGQIKNGDRLIKGSPLIALEVFNNTPGLQVGCLFTELDKDNSNQLSYNISCAQAEWSMEDHARIRVRAGCKDHKDILLGPRIDYKIGMLYWDGRGEHVYPAFEINYWLKRHPMHDVLAMASGTAPKRRGDTTRLDQLLLTVPKGRDVWLSDTHTKWQWIFALVTGWPHLARQISAAGIPLYKADSPRGKQILRRLRLTKQELKDYEQPFLFNEGV